MIIMASNRMSIEFSSPHDALETVVAVLAKHKNEDYYAYEREDVWYIGLGSQTSLLIDPTGTTATIITWPNTTSRLVDKDIAIEIAREFVHANSTVGKRIYGQTGFNYGAYTRGLKFNPGKWPLLGLMSPRNEITVRGCDVTITGFDEEEVTGLFHLIKHDFPKPDLF